MKSNSTLWLFLAGAGLAWLVWGRKVQVLVAQDVASAQKAADLEKTNSAKQKDLDAALSAAAEWERKFNLVNTGSA